MPDVIRKLVSGRKNRHVENGVNLDLTYITEKIIIMGYPASGVASLYRNDRYKVRDFLDDKHYPQDDCHYRVYNLVPASENSYDPVFFRGHVSRFPFPDHHVPPLSLIPLMVSDAKAWLMEHPDNVVVIHCKAGLGRSGTFACCLLLALDPSLTGATSLMEASETEAIQMVSDALFREQQGGEDSSSDFDNSFSRDDTSRSTSLSYSRQMNSSSSRLRSSTDVGRSRSSLQVGRREESKEETRAEVSDRLKAVFDLHTSKRIKAPKEKKSVIPLSEQNGGNQTNEIETGDSGVKMEASADRNTDTVKERSPRRVRSVKDIVSMVSNSGRSRSKSSTGTVVGRSPSQARQREEEGGGDSSSQLYAGMGNASRSSFVSVEPHSLGASPRGMSTDMLPLSDTSFEGLADGRQPRIGNGNGPAWLEVDPADQIRSSSRNRNRASYKSPTPKEPSTMNSHHQNQSTQSVNEVNKSPIASKPGVSIPSQRRWVGYFARILSGEDARLTFSSPCGFASPLTASSNPAITSKTRRKIKITRISIDRKSTTKALPIRNDLSIQIGHYEDALVQRLETWESNARRRARAFGIHDPGAISPKAEDEDKEMDFNTKQHSSSSTSLSAMATRIQSNNGGGTETPSSFFSQDPRSQLFQSHSSSKLGGPNWSLKINPQTEADRARNFDWGESDGNGKQLVYGERLMETRRENLGEENDGKKLRYIFIPGDCDLDDPLQDQNKGDERREVLLSPEPRRKKSTIFGRKSKEISRTGDDLPAVSLVPPTPPPPASDELQGFDQSSTSIPSPKAKNGGTNSSNPNLIIDPDREIMFKVLVGRTGATHSLLPDFTAAAWCWIIPSFEEPRELNKPFDDEDEDEGEGGERVAREREWRKGKKNAVKVKKGSKTVVRLERDELDFRKHVLGVEALEVEWEWVEI